MFRTLFEKYIKDLSEKNTSSLIFKHFLENMDESYLKNSTSARIAIDFIAGMTDDYFLNEYKKVSN